MTPDLPAEVRCLVFLNDFCCAFTKTFRYYYSTGLRSLPTMMTSLKTESSTPVNAAIRQRIKLLKMAKMFLFSSYLNRLPKKNLGSKLFEKV